MQGAEKLRHANDHGQVDDYLGEPRFGTCPAAEESGTPEVRCALEGNEGNGEEENSFPYLPTIDAYALSAISAGQRPENPNRKITYTGEGSGTLGRMLRLVLAEEVLHRRRNGTGSRRLHGVKVQPTSATDGPHLADSHAFVIASGHWRRK